MIYLKFKLKSNLGNLIGQNEILELIEKFESSDVDNGIIYVLLILYIDIRDILRFFEFSTQMKKNLLE